MREGYLDQKDLRKISISSFPLLLPFQLDRFLSPFIPYPSHSLFPALKTHVGVPRGKKGAGWRVGRVLFFLGCLVSFYVKRWGEIQPQAKKLT